MAGGGPSETELSVAEARALANRAMLALGHDATEADAIADHLIDCELRGLFYGGLARAVSIAERIGRFGRGKGPIRIARETPVSALIEGNDQIGYLVATKATEVAVAKAKITGLAAVAAGETWYTGMLSYYAERAAAAGLVSILASNTAPWVAPHGATEGHYGTNPFCIGLPSANEPVVWDIGTSAIIHAQATLAGRLGQPLPEGVAFAPDGVATRDPAVALLGAFAAWGGHKGSGLGIAVQLLGSLAGGDVLPPGLCGFGFLIVVIDPALFGDADTWRANVADYADAVRAARPEDPGQPVRMPFDRSRQERARRLAEDRISVAAEIVESLQALCS
jgi:LDH2 family malate/lactate/ureidoglycolate dehydrogenase